MKYLADTSVWNRSRLPQVKTRWEELIVRDEIVVCDQVVLEVLFSAQSAKEYDLGALNFSGFDQAVMDTQTYGRAREIQQRLAHVGGLHHRSVTIADLLIAAAAEFKGVTVLHYDEDFDRIADITGQPTEWVAPRGSL
jgi:predicted nucleic acid-binding protein